MEPFLGELRLFPYAWAPRGFAICDGTLLPIQQNQALYVLLGTMYGGDGKTNFALPDLRGRVPLMYGIDATSGQLYQMGKSGGKDAVVVTSNQVPTHAHLVAVNTATSDQLSPAAHVLGPVGAVTGKPTVNLYVPYVAASSKVVNLSASTFSIAGGNAAHNNMQPYLTLNFCIAVEGYWPPRP